MQECTLETGTRLIARPDPLSTGRIDLAMPEGSTVAEMVAAAGLEIPAWANAHLFIDDLYVPRDRWHLVRPRAGRTVSLSVVPSGGGGKNPLRVILQIAVLAAVAIFAPQLAPAFEGFLSAKAAFNLASGVIGLAGSLLVNAIAPPATPKFDRLSAERDSPTYAISGGSNALRPWGPVPMVLGRHRVFPPYAAQPYTELDGDDQFWRAMFLIGYGPVDLEELKIGETPIEDFPDVEVEIREGHPSDPPRALFTDDVFEEGLSIELTEAGSWQQRTTPQEVDEISVDVTFPSGLATIANNGTRQNRLVAIEVQYAPAGTGQWSVGAVGRAFAVRQAGPMGAPSPHRREDNDRDRYRTDRVVVDKLTGALSVLKGRRTTHPPSAKPPPVPPWAIPIARVSRRTGQQVIGAASIVDERPADAPFGDPGDFAPSVTSPASASIEIGAGTLFDPGITTVARQTTTVRRGLRFPVPVRGLYDVRLRRMTPDSSSPQIVDRAFWTVLRAIRHVDPVQLPGMATVALRIRATGSLSGVIQQFNCIATSVVPDWTGIDWVEQATSNPASLYRHLFQGPHMTRPRSDAQIDLAGLQGWADANAADGRAFNAYIDFSTTLRELAGDVAAAGRAGRGMIDGKWTVVRDRPQNVPVQVLTPRNSWGFHASKAFVDPPHGLNVRFINEQAGYERDERVVYADGFDETTATRLEALDLFGITDPGLAWRDGRFHQAVAKLRPETYELNVDFEHIVATRGDLVSVAHDAVLIGLAQGRVKAVQTDGGGAATGVTLDELVTMEVGKTYALTLRPPAGDPITRAVTTAPGETDTVVFATTIPAGTVAAGDLAAFGETDRVTADMLIREIRPGPDNSARLVLVDAAPAVHGADLVPVEFAPTDVDTATDRIAIADNPFFNGDILRFTTTDTLPPSLPVDTDTYVVGRDDAGIQVSLAKGGAPIDLTGGGAGTHTAARQIPPFDSQVTPPLGAAVPAVESVASEGAALFRDVDGSLTSRILVRLFRVSGEPFDLASIEGAYRIAGTDLPFVALARVPAELREYSFRPVQDGETYEFRLRYLTASGEPGPWGPVITHTVEGKSAPPADVVGFSAQQNDNVVTFQWSQIPDLDRDGYELRYAKRTGAFDWGNAIVLTSVTRGTLVTNAGLPPGDWTVAIKAVDTSGNYSANATTFDIAVSNQNDIVVTIEHRGRWAGTRTGLIKHDVSGRLILDSKSLAVGDDFTVFDAFNDDPVDVGTFESREYDFGFDAEGVRVWADSESALGPSVAAGLADPAFEIDYRSAAGAYDGFEPWTVGLINARYFKTKTTITAAEGVAYLDGLDVTADLKERIERDTGVIVAVGGTPIMFSKPYHAVPAMKVSAEGTTALIPVYSDLSTTGFTVQIFNTSGVDVGGTGSYTATGI